MSKRTNHKKTENRQEHEKQDPQRGRKPERGIFLYKESSQE